ncbi:hypothetical protein A1Q2_00943 [Trichosporon asahii var. asahii CBS 8904]|uniref:Uncharacterized protein n=1 Tax=Trichosporon asahii var. asahii (strain CBS 8904) TaxID=1220162 RepID=K1W760_TRIAC|nr:hypothetical protein A1Q2_00943 [Trichosporon asahii var. asahii CBS 8904]
MTPPRAQVRSPPKLDQYELLYNSAVQSFVRRDHVKTQATLARLLDLTRALPRTSSPWYDVSSTAAPQPGDEWMTKTLKLAISANASLYSDPPRAPGALAPDVADRLPPASPRRMLGYILDLCVSTYGSSLLPPALVSTFLLATSGGLARQPTRRIRARDRGRPPPSPRRLGRGRAQKAPRERARGVPEGGGDLHRRSPLARGRVGDGARHARGRDGDGQQEEGGPVPAPAERAGQARLAGSVAGIQRPAPATGHPEHGVRGEQRGHSPPGRTPGAAPQRLDNLKQVTDTLLLGAVLRAEDPGRLRAIKDSGAVLLLLLECRVLVRLGRGGGEVLLGNGRDLVSEQGRGGDDEALAGGLGDRKRR